MKEILSKKYLTLIICFLLITANLIIFVQIKNHTFCNLDDPVYVTQNLHIQSGLTLKNINWAFTTTYAYFWHPLTWLSLMMDYGFYGLNPAGYHIMNLVFHMASTILLFLIFRRMTNTIWQSALVAMLFAIHPLHVESVVWVAERKDVLSTFFWMLTMGAYVIYSERPGLGRYVLIMVFFTLGLMAKPMLVTLPFVLLLLDYWPLKRLKLYKTMPEPEEAKAKCIDNKLKKQKKHDKLRNKVKQEQQDVSTRKVDKRVTIGYLIKEKVPLFILAFLFTGVAIYAQQVGSAESTNQGYPLQLRIANALISYMLYIFKMLWPVNLTVFYPFPGAIPLWQSFGSALIIIIATLFIVRASMLKPYLAVGWFWYIGTLVPVIGIMQVGNHAMADRYTYIPLIGMFVLIIWGISDLAKMWRFSSSLLSGFSVMVVTALIIISWKQAALWQNDIILYEHALKVTSGNYLAHNNLGAALYELGKNEEALFHHEEALRINPASFQAHFNMANILAFQGKRAEAIYRYEEAIKLNRNYLKAHRNLGTALALDGRFKEAIEHYKKAIEIDGSDPTTFYNLGMAFAANEQADEAINQFKEALNIKPDFPEVYNDMGKVFAMHGRIDEAIGCFRKALWLKPDFSAARRNLDTAMKSKKISPI